MHYSETRQEMPHRCYKHEMCQLEADRSDYRRSRSLTESEKRVRNSVTILWYRHPLIISYFSLLAIRRGKIYFDWLITYHILSECNWYIFTRKSSLLFWVVWALQRFHIQGRLVNFTPEADFLRGLKWGCRAHTGLGGTGPIGIGIGCRTSCGA